MERIVAGIHHSLCVLLRMYVCVECIASLTLLLYPSSDTCTSSIHVHLMSTAHLMPFNLYSDSFYIKNTSNLAALAILRCIRILIYHLALPPQ